MNKPGLLQLTAQQRKDLAAEWIQDQCAYDYKVVLTLVFNSARSASWNWMHAIGFIVDLCAKAYFVPRESILQELGYDAQEPGLLALQALIEATDEMNAAGPEGSDRRALAQAKFIQAWEKARELIDPSTD